MSSKSTTSNEQSLRELARLKSFLFSNLGHELKTPIHNILAVVQVVLNEVDGKLSTEQKKEIGLIKNNAEHLLSIINSVLDHSNLNSTTVKVTPTQFDLAELVRVVVSLNSQQNQSKQVEIKVESKNLPTHFWHDAVLITQILNQLIENAVKFSKHGQTVCLNVEVSASEIQIVVSDQGLGISEEYKPFLFEEFSQLDFKENRKYSGLGLGLNIVKRAVDLLKGSISLESKVGQGTKIKVKIPQIKTENRPKILIVEDEEAIRNSLKQCLISYGFEVAEAENGQAALKVSPSYAPDLIILDMKMPLMSGSEFLKLAREQIWGAKLPIIVMSAFSNKEDREGSFQAGATDFMAKPFSIQEMLARVNTVLKNAERK